MKRLLACFALLACHALAQPALGAQVNLTGDVATGIRTDLHDKPDAFGYRVTWIDWDSYFRESELRIGDVLLGVEEFRYARKDISLGNAIGQHGERTFWAKRGAKDGDTVKLAVFRDGQEIAVTGRLRAERQYRSEAGRALMDECGPERLNAEKDSDGRQRFNGSSWSSWYEAKINGQSGSYPYIMDGGWERGSFNSRKELEAHLADQARIDHLAAKYPCKFAQTMKSDWERVRDYLQGRAMELGPDALEYRTRAERLTQEVRKFGGKAIGELETALGARLQRSPALPSGGVGAQRAAYAGKVVYFGRLSNQNIINDLNTTLMVAGSAREGYYFIEAESPVMDQVFGSVFRYRANVNPSLAERYSVYLEVLDEPRIITFQRTPVMGLMARVVGMVGGDNEVFVDARNQESAAIFAGERETAVTSACPAQKARPPEAVIGCMVEAVKRGDKTTWQSLFAPWRFIADPDGGSPLFDPNYRLPADNFERAWERSRRSITSEVFDARVSRISPVRQVHRRANEHGVPTVERVEVILDHIGKFGDQYRTYVSSNVRRRWVLQRLDGGEWKIAEVQHL